MNPDRSSPLPGLSPGAENDSEVVRVLDAYLSSIEAGQPADPDRLLADHPALASRLRVYLEVMNLAGRLAEDSHARPGVMPADSSTDAQIPPLGRGREACDESTPPPGASLLSTLDLGPGPPPQIQLHELLDESEPLVRPRSAEMPDQNGSGVGCYQLQGEIARGGMGAILKGRDVDLGRDLAIKVLLESHQGNSDVVRRFIEEAQIGGQLQHPGVVPVYELGAFPDRRPYFAMKLVKGRTLASLLTDQPISVGAGSVRRSGPDRGTEAPPTGRLCPPHDLPRFLSIFEQVCQTMAYAHARGVIHRDLKPSNVMVGSFGEVQVMDWGLAKVLPQGGIADEAQGQLAQQTVIMTVRSGSAGSGSESQAGSVLGTPVYMAPEQARGEVDRIDERADVFGLGAILCEILTGQPPFTGATREEIRAQSARGDLSDALCRLDACAAEPELIDLARDCLAPEQTRRPRSAGEVARRISGYLAGVQERLRTAELARVEMQARAEEETRRRAVADELAREARARADEERKRRQMTAALAVSMLGLFILGGSGWAYLARQRTARLMATTQAATEALAEAERLRGQAQLAAIGDMTKWSQAMAAARYARALLAEGEPDQALRQKVAVVLAEFATEQAAAQRQAAERERDGKLLTELEAIRANLSEHWNQKQADRDYAAAFRAFGIDLDELDPDEAGKQIARRSDPVALASYLDDWSVRRRQARGKKDDVAWRRLLAEAAAADPDPWRVALRNQIRRNALEALR